MSYDRLGRLLTAANAHSTITRSYDPAGRQLSETQDHTNGPAGTFQYQYDSDGQLARHIRPDGSYIDYQYNQRNLLSNLISDAPPPVATYTYNGRNQIEETVIENGLFTATRTYDGAGRLTALTNSTLDTTAYTLSPDGRRTAIQRSGDTLVPVTETYDYDNARQVTNAAYPDLSTTQVWNYDPAGNRTSSQISNPQISNQTTTYTANAVNEYTTITGFPAVPTYDPNGNLLTSQVLPLGSSSLVSSVLTWNINNEMTGATNGNGDTAQYSYDALGRRTKRVETIASVTTTTYFFTNGWNVELEHQGSAGVPPAFTRRLTWGLDLSGSLQGAGGVGGLVMVGALPPGGAAPIPHFPTYDGTGNITAWVNASGTVVSRQRYDAFGNIIQQTGTAPSTYGFSTKPIDVVTGYLYYGYRYYDPVTGRWPSRDPIGERGGVNLYGFVGNDGVNKWDYLGKVSGTKIIDFPGHNTDGYRFGYEFVGKAQQDIVQHVEVKSTLECCGDIFFEMTSSYHEAFTFSANGKAYDRHIRIFPQTITVGIVGQHYQTRPQICKDLKADITFTSVQTFTVYENPQIQPLPLPQINNNGETFGFSYLDSFNGTGPSTSYGKPGGNMTTIGQPTTSAYKKTGVTATGGQKSVGVTHTGSSVYGDNGTFKQYNKDAKSPPYK